MSEYILFDATLRDRFLEFLAERGIASDVRPDQIEGFVVTLPDDLTDDVEEEIEDEYETLMAEQQRLVESADAGDTGDLMAVTITLSDGQPRVIRLPVLYARRLFEHFSIAEIHELVSAIAQGAVSPDAGPICRSR